MVAPGVRACDLASPGTFSSHVLTSVNFSRNYFQYCKSDLLTCNKIPELMDGFIGGRHIFNILHVKWSNFCNFAYNLTKFLSMLGHDLEISCTKFHENRLIIDGEIDEKHALKIIVS